MTLPAWLIEVVQANERIARREEAETPQRKERLLAAEWDALFDGQRHVVTPPNTRWFQNNAIDAAKRRGVVVHTRRFGPQIVVQAERKAGAA